MQGGLKAQGKLPAKETPPLKKTRRTPPPLEQPPLTEHNGHSPTADEAKIANLEQEIAQMREMLQSSGRVIARAPEELDEIGDDIQEAFQGNQEMIAVPIVQKVITNAKNLMHYDYAKSQEGYKGDFGDSATTA